MFHLSRHAPVVGAALMLVALLASIQPAGAELVPNAITSNAMVLNGLSFNAITSNAITSNALAATGSGLGKLNGVSIEAVTLPEAATR